MIKIDDSNDVTFVRYLSLEEFTTIYKMLKRRDEDIADDFDWFDENDDNRLNYNGKTKQSVASP